MAGEFEQIQQRLRVVEQDAASREQLRREREVQQERDYLHTKEVARFLANQLCERKIEPDFKSYRSVQGRKKPFSQLHEWTSVLFMRGWEVYDYRSFDVDNGGHNRVEGNAVVLHPDGILVHGYSEGNCTSPTELVQDIVLRQGVKEGLGRLANKYNISLEGY